ncbi:hypothetical protein AAVH_40157 [Aphelenchoides avenae]|nr:hypothetical protein AAVH_40157 [Aphelenchus avenae]
MNADHFYESFFFCSRDDLEGLQLVRKSVRNRIVRASRVLPLRSIRHVDMIYYLEEHICIFVGELPETDPFGDDEEPDYEDSIHDGDFAETFGRLQNACIKEFVIGIRDSAFLRYWISQEAASCTVVSIDFPLHEVAANGTGILDSIMNRLRPRFLADRVEQASWYKYGSNSAYTELLARESFVNSLHTCSLLGANSEAYSPPDFFLNGPSYRNYELCCSHLDTSNLIDGFIESFVRDEYPNKKLESVWLRTREWNERARTPKKLSNTTKVDVPLPENNFTAWYGRHLIRRVSQCEMRSFENTKQWKRMDVLKWSVEYARVGDGPITNHVFLFRVKNL